MSEPIYFRRQAPLWFSLMIAVWIAAAVAAWFTVSTHFSLLLVAGFGVLLLLLFGGLSVSVTAKDVTLSFGAGLIRRTISRDEIVSSKAVRNKWWYGFGIRLTPHGWMWNISGLDAVEIEYKDGRRFRIGTADPQGLLAALGHETPT